MEILDEEDAKKAQENQENAPEILDESTHEKKQLKNKLVQNEANKKTKQQEIQDLLQHWFSKYKKMIITGTLIAIIASVVIANLVHLTGKNNKILTDDEALLIKRQQILEKEIKEEISHGLEKMFGPNNYHVGVVAYFSLVNERYKNITHEPKVVTLNSELQESHEEFALPIQRPLQTQSAPTTTASQNNLDLPGMFDDIQTQGNFVNNTLPSTTTENPNEDLLSQTMDMRLPGFENMTIQNFDLPQPVSGQNNNQNIESKLSDETEEKPNKPKKITKTQRNNNHIVFDQTISSRELPKIKFENLYVSVVVNKVIADRSGMQEKDLARFLEVMSGVNTQRGDRFAFSMVPFRDHVLDARHTGIEARKVLSNIPIWLYLLIGILIFLAKILPAPIKAFLLKKQLKKEDQAKAATLAKQEEEQAKIKEEQAWSAQRNQVLEMAKNNPETMAHMLLDWIEQKESTSEKSDEAPTEEKKDDKKDDKKEEKKDDGKK